MYLERLSTAYLQASSWLTSQVILPYEALSDSKVRTTNTDERWDTITPSKDLQWHGCFNEFKCARLEVPMDWNNASDSRTVSIALVKVEATVPITDPSYGGAVIMNPGGPGGSGISQVLKSGYYIRTILSAGPDTPRANERHFDILGFDPRGINNTLPLLNCHPDHLSKAAWDIESNGRSILGSSDTAFDELWAAERAVAEGCSKRAAEEGIAEHMSTAPVARDIVEIFERHGEWRAGEAQRLLHGSTWSTDDLAAISERIAYRKGKEMIQYWGFSYGSILGATLSAMFPERIQRAVLDGVADSFDYMAGAWKTNLQDTDMLIVRFADYCWQGGPKRCAMYHEDGPAFIIEEFLQVVTALQSNPISVPDDGGHGPMVVTYSDLKHLIREIVYNPLSKFPETAQVLYDLSQGNGSSLAEFKRSSMPSLSPELSDLCKKDGPYSASCFTPETRGSDATSGILCSDGLPNTNMTKEEYREYVGYLAGQSLLIGDSWAGIRMPCTAWNALPKWRYDGNFTNTTAHPILFAGNTVDPVTPLRNAYAMARGFEGAGVLHQDSEGHCTYAAPSMCTGRALRGYFQTGQLPGRKGGLEAWAGTGALCEPDVFPFDGFSEDEKPRLPKGETDQELWDAMVGMHRVLR